MTTARQIITRAMQLNGVITKNESPSGDELNDGLESLNDLLLSWSNDSLLAFARLSESFPLVSGKEVYTIGEGGDFNTVRPTQILTAFTRIGNVDYNIDIINGVAYDAITFKSTSSSIPEALFYDANSPLAKITIYPVPTTGTLFLRTEKPLSTFTSLDTNLELPPGWDRALKYNLSIEQAPEYGQQVDVTTFQIATESLNKIRTAVARNKDMNAYPITTDFNNIFIGWYNT